MRIAFFRERCFTGGFPLYHPRHSPNRVHLELLANYKQVAPSGAFERQRRDMCIVNKEKEASSRGAA
jgi:hypothetical protein